ncbi:multicomponent Na+:H+ antiporter subunit A [Crenobacter luteus]|uniref:hydrogen gas-evolving membrane-bound hydrogenase subunit E n=1 Tax=Crenobacter luteus TaxID=1452487 RepID=UPI00104494FF|nr:hydrogen gas-evolving membrane-bound hydrogenase subunit E [Crenobacter luteus]TCP13025.1 multicomponent Na+:H+ antiporter subunit A [Crenobacter luteus]
MHATPAVHPPLAAWVRFAWLLPALLFALALGNGRWPLGVEFAWVAALDVAVAFHIDGLSRLFVLLITGIGALVLFYAPAYLAGDPRLASLVRLLLAFMAAMLGAVCADDLVLLFLFWEATSVLSFLLVGFDHEKPASREAARQALLVTGGGGLVLLAGLLLLLEAAPGLRLSTLSSLDAATVGQPLFAAGVALVLVGAMSKSAQFPFHFWLPGAMSAPTPVSAYLHSATMVKLGVYLLARFDPALSGVLSWWADALVAIGTLTAVWAAVLSLRERDLKRILAWSTVSALGTLTLLIGLPNEWGALAFAIFLLAHALYKAPLFFVAGNVDHATGTRSIDRLRGMRRALPLTATAAVLAGLSMAGLPASLGYVAKDVMSIAKSLSEPMWLVGAASVVVSAVGVAVAAVAALRVFFGPADGPPLAADGQGVSLRLDLPPLLLALCGLLLGLFPAWAEPVLLEAAGVVAPRLAGALPVLGLVDGPRLGGVAIVVALGAATYGCWDRFHLLLERLRPLDAFGPAAGYRLALRLVKSGGALVGRRMQNGRTGFYLCVSVLAVVALAAPLLPPPRWSATALDGADLGFAAAAALAVVGAVSAVAARDTLARLLAAGLVGVACAMVFLFRGAPDLAFTQLVVETVFVVVAAVALRRHRPLSPPPRVGALRAAVAVAFGALLGGLTLAVQQAPPDTQLSQFFLGASLPQAHGRNVVNVIIVDFRALDTLGEIAVVLLAAVAARPLVAALRGADAATAGRSVILAHAVAFLYPLMLFTAALVLLRGHNAPGGGFIAALLAVSASAAIALVFGPAAARSRLPLAPPALAAAGLVLALLSGLPALLLGQAFLTHQWGEITLGGFSFAFSTVLLFDLGVLCCVWGALAGFCLRLLGEGR